MNAMQVASRSTFHLSQMLCCRGLEYMSNEGKERQEKIRRTACEAVLQEQDRQRGKGIRPDEGAMVLSLIYKKFSQRSSIAANMLGSLDATESMNIYDESADLNELMMQVVANNSTISENDLLNSSLPNVMLEAPSLALPTSTSRAPKRRNSIGSVSTNGCGGGGDHHHNYYANNLMSHHGHHSEDPMEMGRIINGLLTQMQL